MLSIIMIEETIDETSAKQILQTLEASNIACNIHLERNVVIVDDTNDKIRLAKQLLADAGFQVL